MQVKHLATIEQSETYECAVTLKADVPRDVVCDILQTHRPYEHFCELTTFRLTENWQTYRMTFTADPDEPDAQIVIAAAGSRAPLEIGEMTFTTAVPAAVENALGRSPD